MVWSGWVQSALKTRASTRPALKGSGCRREKLLRCFCRFPDRFRCAARRASLHIMPMGPNNSGAKEFWGPVHESADEIWLKARHDAVSPTGRATARIQKEGEAYTDVNALASPINPRTTRKYH